MNMKRNQFTIMILVLVIVAGVLLSGCSAPGQTSAEVNRRHRDHIQQKMLQMQDDVDAVMMIDQPSRLSDKMVR